MSSGFWEKGGERIQDTEHRTQKAEGGGQKTEGGRQRTENTNIESVFAKATQDKYRTRNGEV